MVSRFQETIALFSPVALRHLRQQTMNFYVECRTFLQLSRQEGLVNGGYRRFLSSSFECFFNVGYRRLLNSSFERLVNVGSVTSAS